MRPVVPAGAAGGVDELQHVVAVAVGGLLVQVDADVGDAGRPAQLQQQRRVVERSRRRVQHVALDAAVLAGRKGFHRELDEAVVAEQALPALRGGPTRVDPAGRTASGVARRTVGARAVARARHAQCGRQGERLLRVGHETADGGRTPAGRAVGRATRVVDDVHVGQLVACVVDVDDQPIQDWEDFVEAGVAVQVGVVEAEVAAIAHADVVGHQRQAGLARLGDAVAGNAGGIIGRARTAIAGVHEHAAVEVGAPLRDRHFHAISGARPRAARIG